VEFYVIGDEDTVQGFRYVGIPGKVVTGAQQAAAELARLAETKEELIIITTEQIANTVRDEVNALRFGEELPLVVEIPGPGGPSADSPSLLRMIREAVGVKF
jgi:V/A-type H+-transporting ATPase subunit F